MKLLQHTVHRTLVISAQKMDELKKIMYSTQKNKTNFLLYNRILSFLVDRFHQ